MNPNPTWHATPDQLAGYVGGALGRSQAASVEAHLVACPVCRAATRPFADVRRLERNLTAIAARVDQPPQPCVERWLRRVGVPGHVARLFVVTPTEPGVWITCILTAMVVAGATAIVTGSDRSVFLFLVAAPLLPLVGVASAVTLRGDPLRELLASVPTPAFTTFLVRSLSVLAPTIVLAACAAVLVPRFGWEPVLWLLPAFGLCATTLALGTWLPVRIAACASGIGWITAAFLAGREASPADAVDSFVAFRPAGQLAMLGLSIVGLAIATLRRDAFDLVDLGRTS
jgi:anti-sigma factor RsiW